jgi:5-methyltetrahydropteroyltriglutamate--homocysteine methyltransferase
VRRSKERILTTHTGSLPLPEDLIALVRSKAQGAAVDEADYQNRLQAGYEDIVGRQAESGIDVINDGELSKTSWFSYILERVEGIETRERTSPREMPQKRDRLQFPDYFERPTKMAVPVPEFVCVGPIKYAAHDALRADIERLKAALDGVAHEEGFMTAMTPATSELFLTNEYYSNLEDLWSDLAEALRVEYEAITEAGFILQLDDPSIASMWNYHPEYTVEDVLTHERTGVEAVNHALRNVPRDRVRLHVCWGAIPGPHANDIPLEDIVGLLLTANVGAYSVEASNPRHEHEWRAWEGIQLPEGTVVIPGVVSHKTDTVEHPRVVADRIVRYATILGRENVVAGTDCGMATGRIHPSLAWAKLRSLSDGARVASEELWSR